MQSLTVTLILQLTLSLCDLQSLYYTCFNLPTQTTHPPHHALTCRTYCHPSTTPNSSIHITIYIIHSTNWLIYIYTTTRLVKYITSLVNVYHYLVIGQLHTYLFWRKMGRPVVLLNRLAVFNFSLPPCSRLPTRPLSKIITINNCCYCHCCCHLVAGPLPIHWVRP